MENQNEEAEVSNSSKQVKKTKKFKKQKERKKVTFGSIFKGIFLSVFGTIIVLCVTLFAVLYFKFNVNSFELIKNSIIVNKSVKTENLVTNNFSESDYASFNNKITAFDGTENVLLLSDREIAGYIDYLVKNGSSDLNEKLSGVIKTSDVSLVQLDFYNVTTNKNDKHLSDVNVVLSLDSLKLKQEDFGSFPKNILAKIIPAQIYCSFDFEIKRIDNLSVEYDVEYKSMKINNLSAIQSESFLDDINSFVNIGLAEDLGLEVGNIISDTIIGKDEKKGIYGELIEAGAKGYSFYSEGLIDNFIIYTKEITNTAAINYNNLKTATNDNINEYTVLDNVIKLRDISATGYNFLGWYDDVSDDANLVLDICAWNLSDVNLYAHWQLIEYKIEYVLRGGILDEDKVNPGTYTIESVIILNSPYKKFESDGKIITVPFLGWTGSNGSTPVINLEIRNTCQDLKFYALFEDDERSLFLNLGNKVIGEMTIILNETIDRNEIDTLTNDYLNQNYSGYMVDKWYTDSNLQTEYNFQTIVTDDNYLYADLKYMVDDLTFYPSISKFEAGVRDRKIELNSRAEFKAYFEYISFYLITDEVLLKLNYLNDYSDFDNEFRIVNDSVNVELFPFHQMSYAVLGFKGMGGVKMSIVNSFWNNGGELSTIDPDKTYTNTQKDYALALKNPNTRTDNYDDFKINNITKSLKVEHSWQLVYCLEQGYRPICVPNSNAELMYNKAKTILRNICDDSMNNFQKTRAIYEWLILNVNYDQKALEIAEQNNYSSKNLSKYDSWHIEGVFNNGVAVCEAYAKAFLVMAKIEGIPMIYITGNLHAWNRVYLNGNWYGIDATQGDTQQNTSRIEVLNNYNFLFTDEYKTSLGFTSDDYSQFKATTVYNYYKNATFTYNSVTFDLHCETNTEVNILVTTLRNYAISNQMTNYTFEIEVGNNLSFGNVSNVICKTYSLSSISGFSETTVSGYKCFIFSIGS